MKKWILGLVLLPLFSFYVSDWKRINLDSRVSVDFPEEPTPGKMPNMDIWYINQDPQRKIMVSVLDYNHLGVDSVQLADETSRPEALEQFRNNMLAQMPGSEFVSEKRSKIQGYTCFDFEFLVGKDANTRTYIKNVFVGSKLYLLSYQEIKDKISEDIRDRFLNSVVIK